MGVNNLAQEQKVFGPLAAFCHVGYEPKVTYCCAMESRAVRRATGEGVEASAEAQSSAGVREESQLGGETQGQGNDGLVRDQSRPEGSQGRGDLLRNLNPVEPFDFLVNVGQQAIGDGVGLRRVEVTRREGNEGENHGALGGTVQGVHPLNYPQGRPTILGPPVMPPAPAPFQGYPLGIEYPPGPFDPVMAMRNPQYAGNWFGTPGRPVDWGVGQVNPFWSPEARRALENVEHGRISQVPRALERALDRTEGVPRPRALENLLEGDPEQVQRGDQRGEEVDGLVNRETPNPEDSQQRTNMGWMGTPLDPRVVDEQSVVMDPIELFRIRCLREAEQKFVQGLEKLRNETQGKNEGSNGSYVSIPVHGEGTPQNKGMGYGPGGPPPGLNGKEGVHFSKEPVGETASESLRSLELPKLSEGSTPLMFGDWLAIIEPLMADIGSNSSSWWALIMKTVRESYEIWLTEGPLDRLRRTVEIPKSALIYPRTEKRAVTMILQSLPDRLKTEMVSSRRLTTPQIMFRLFCLFQPGGQTERAVLLQSLTEFRLSGNGNEQSGSMRQWIRWLERGEELGIVLPDPMILSGVMSKASDVVGKAGAQVGFRLASARQQLHLDTRPTMPNVKLFAEYLLAETEELVISGTTPNPPSGQGGSKPVVKAVGVENGAPKDGVRDSGYEGKGLQPGNAANVTSKTPCKFWMSEEGCKRGDKCKFTHTILDPKDNRCFLCSGLGHGKRDCPVGAKKKLAKTQSDKGPKKPETADKRGQKPETEKPGPSKPGDQGSSGDGRMEQSNPPQKPPEDPKNGLGELLHEASCLMKALRPSLKAVVLRIPQCCKAEVSSTPTGLLDGGATNVLRKGSPSEIRESDEVTVELASGTTQLYQHRLTGSLLTSRDVEPIVPLRGVVSLGYKIKWDKTGCTIHHPSKGKLSCWLRNGCPVVRESHALQLIKDIEDQERRKSLEPKVASGQLSEKVRVWWKKHYPKVPEGVLKHMMGQFDGKPPSESLPWNRHVRRRVEKSKALVIHLYSGPKDVFWKKDWPAGVEVLTVDNRADPRQNLHDPAVWAYLVHLITTKRVLGIVGGPPCRSVSRLRHNELDCPGPRPVRGRGSERFGLRDLTEAETKLVDGDGALFLKQLALYDLTKESEVNAESLVGFLLESPEDPLSYDDSVPNCPSFWDWDELVEFKEKHQLDLISFDQGCVGHPQKKPTSCLTNLTMVMELQGQRIVGKRGSGLKQDVNERFKQTASWSEWAVELKMRIKISLVIIAAECGWSIPNLKKILDREGWKQHILQGHRPYRRDCRACILDMASGPPHRRKVNNGSSAWSMGVDVLQMAKTKDLVSGSDAKYAVVATVLVPFFETEHVEPLPEGTPETVEPGEWGEGLEEKEFPISLEEPQLELDEAVESKEKDPRGSEAENLWDEFEEADIEISGDKRGPPKKPQENPNEEKRGNSLGLESENQKRDESPPKDPQKDLEELVDRCKKPLKLKHLTLVEPVGSRQAGEILSALSLLITKFRSMGVCVNRLHGDRAKELLSNRVQQWCTRNNVICTLGGDMLSRKLDS